MTLLLRGEHLLDFAILCQRKPEVRASGRAYDITVQIMLLDLAILYMRGSLKHTLLM